MRAWPPSLRKTAHGLSVSRTPLAKTEKENTVPALTALSTGDLARKGRLTRYEAVASCAVSLAGALKPARGGVG
jgi:hypothetical protein